MPKKSSQFASILTIILLLLPTVSSADLSAEMHAKAAQVFNLFEEHDVQGTLVVTNIGAIPVLVHNPERAGKRFAPASTFKILNTLIGLDQGVVDSAESSFAWDGKVHGIESWNQDQTLASAFKRSCVWCYQQIARKVGLQHYRERLQELEFGNQLTGEVVDEFWLNSELTVSATEQILFLKALASGTLPFAQEHQQILKTIMLNEEGADYRLYAKTGWAIRVDKVGWFVGYVERAGQTSLFAMNMEMDDGKKAKLRKQITMEALKILEIID